MNNRFRFQSLGSTTSPQFTIQKIEGKVVLLWQRCC
jgi:hypothetical protein